MTIKFIAESESDASAAPEVDALDQLERSLQNFQIDATLSVVGQFAVAALYERTNLLDQKPGVIDRSYR
jgi:hypothetical protein